MAVTCTLLASAGFVGAGYVGNAPGDDGATLAAASVRESPAAQSLEAAVFDSFTAQTVGMNVRFPGSLLSASKRPEVFDLTSPTGVTPQLFGTANAVRGDVPEIPAALISQVRKEIVIAAYEGLGHSYVWGGTSFAHGWDCSGFVQWAYAQAGVALPRTEQWLPMVRTNNPQPGDLVVQNPDGPEHWSHIGIYIGNGEMISALNPAVGTIMHTPAATSNSSAYFTMPGFAVEDAKAAKHNTTGAATVQAAGTTAPAKDATAKATAKPTPKPTKPSKSPTPTPTPGKTTTPTPTPTVTTTPPATASPTPSAKPTPTPSVTTTPSATPSPAPAPTSAASPSGTFTSLPVRASDTATPSAAVSRATATAGKTAGTGPDSKEACQAPDATPATKPAKTDKDVADQPCKDTDAAPAPAAKAGPVATVTRSGQPTP